jgi:FtsZ-interacting cell division protein ZipA
MSDLQLTLLIIGGLVVVGIITFNWFQQWRLRRGLRERPREKREEPAPPTPARPDPPRSEPRLTRERPEHPPVPDRATFRQPPPRLQSETPAPATLAPLPPLPGVDLMIDYVVALDADEPISAAGLADLHTRSTASGRRFRVFGFHRERGEWEEAGRLSGGRYAHLRVALQLVRRTGAVDLASLTALCAAAQECAERFHARATCPDVQATLATARDLDAFCADVDVAIGVNIIAQPETRFPGHRIRALAEAAGLRLEPHGVFHYSDGAQQTLFTLDNHEPAPFLPEQVKQLATTGVTLLLDVPRVANGAAALELMLEVAGELAQGLGGTVVDDNRVPLTERSIKAIQQQLTAIHAKMHARGIAPGSERALRLFS